MILHNLNRFPKGYKYQHGEIQSFDKYDADRLESFGIDEAWYWYAAGDYEGSGQILMRRDDLYDIHDAGHCSCFGPTDDIKFIGFPLNELKSRCSKELLEQVEDLLTAAKK